MGQFEEGSERLGVKTLGALRGIVTRQPPNETSGRVAIWLWVEDPEFVGRADCCTAAMSAELRQMPSQTRRLWRGLLLHTDLTEQDRPTREWTDRARRKIVALGEAEFQRRVARWLNSIPASGRHNQEPVAVTRLGSHLLKSLIWWSTVSRNPDLDDAVVRLSGVRWGRKVRHRRIAGAVALAVSQMHESTQMMQPVAQDPEADIDYLSPVI